MISRIHGLVLSVLLGAAAAGGAYDLITTAHLGDAETKPEVVSSQQIAQRARKLDTWEASLQKTLRARPPALPPLNRYAAVMFVAVPGAATLPTPAPIARRVVQRTKPSGTPTSGRTSKSTSRLPSKHVAKAPVKVHASRIDAVKEPNRNDEPESEAPVAAPVHGPADPVPAPAPAPADVVASAPAAPPAPAPSTPPATLSVEQQCRQLLRAAENKSEQVKNDAERQCEALKDAPEKKG